MIKYFTYENYDDYGQHFIPVNNLYQMNKTASNSFSPDLMKIILNMKRNPLRYYVVINAVGDMTWGCNRNGDGFTEEGLSHKSTRSDIGTPEDFGFATFTYHSRLYRNHVNRMSDKSFGEVVFSHWNPILHRVELIVAIDINTGKDMIDDLEKGLQMAVSMGCRVRYDRCSICGNKAATRAKYCIHLRDHMREIVSRDQAARWSKETGKTILVGSQVFAYNDCPKFFDISKVYVGADRTAYVLGKAASDKNIMYSADIAESMGVTDEMFDKIATNKIAVVKKIGEIDKEIGGPISSDDSDGVMVKSDEMTAIRKALDEKMNTTIAAELRIPNNMLDSMASSIPLESIFSTLFGLGIHPKPPEVQRIVLVRIGMKPMADELEDQGIVFDHNDLPEPMLIDISENDFNNSLGRALTPFLEERSCFPSLLGPRMNTVIIKSAGIDNILNPQPQNNKPGINPGLLTLGGIAALYAGLKLNAMGYGPKQIASTFMDKPWLQALFGGSIMWKIYDELNRQKAIQLPSARDYVNSLQDTNFSGHIKTAGKLSASLGTGLLTSAITLPAAYIANSWNQKSKYTTGKSAFPGAGTNPIIAAGIAGVGATLLHNKFSPQIGAISQGIKKVLKK